MIGHGKNHANIAKNKNIKVYKLFSSDLGLQPIWWHRTK
jgi:metal-dependent HD superfamily phosphatase/phosphodiesterase